MKKAPILLVLCALLISISSCTTQMAKLERSSNYAELLNGAIAFYEKGQYVKAKTLFEKIQPIYQGTEYAEKIRYYWAYSEFYLGLYQLSAYQFSVFYNTYGRSPLAEEAQYMEAYSLYMDSPGPDLEQTSSEEAVLMMQNFLNRYPVSQYYEEANEIIDELQVRFETKAYQTAKLYYRLSTGLSFRNYLEAALTTFQTFKSDFPDSKYNEELMYLSVETSYKLANNSIARLRQERFEKTLKYHRDFVDRFPVSEYSDKVNDYYEKSTSELNKLKTN
ncbi:outer membrane protein assembly factor BamD [Roseivirga misakiensis]|nr:outer membrane protein assembly factor BamD [Roseivirga misakiensis]